MNNRNRRLFLIPSTLGDSPLEPVLPQGNRDILESLNHLIVEEEKTARRFLVRCGLKSNLELIHFYSLNEHTADKEIPLMIKEAGDADLGLLSEAGVPAVADPGAKVVEEAHRQGIQVIPLVGPSSIILALMASGLNGQCFAFNGYLPVKSHERAGKIRFLEKRSETEKQSQVFIEAPYRNNQLTEALLENCKPGTRLCIAANLTLPSEWIKTRPIREWRLQPPPDLNRQPAVYIILA
jgi:16S rRNA (cytidine1402-2'-O)-methyltransferase